MKPITLTSTESAVLAALALLGLLVPNGIFIYCVVTEPALLLAALRNPLSLVFILEAFFLMFLLAWLAARAGSRQPSAAAFIVMSLVGSLAFSVPAALYLALRQPAPKPGGG